MLYGCIIINLSALLVLVCTKYNDVIIIKNDLDNKKRLKLYRQNNYTKSDTLLSIIISR